MCRGVVLAVGQVGGRCAVVQGRGRGGRRHRVGQGRVVSWRATQELGAQPVGHPAGLGHRRDGAVAHRPQVGVLTATGKAMDKISY